LSRKSESGDATAIVSNRRTTSPDEADLEVLEELQYEALLLIGEGGRDQTRLRRRSKEGRRPGMSGDEPFPERQQQSLPSIAQTASDLRRTVSSSQSRQVYPSFEYPQSTAADRH
jgi:hypothetical protein